MSRLRTVPPVRSPITLASILAGFAAATWKRSASSSRARVERALSSHFIDSTLLLTDTGTTALSLALQCSGGADNVAKPVALPAYACYDLATATDAAGAPFILYDLDPSTLSPDWGSLRRALELGANRIVVVHLYGVPVDMAHVQALGAEFNALVIEDAAQGMGGSWQGAPLGAIGSLGILSFGRGKGVTGGRGGALLANDEMAHVMAKGLPSLPDSRTSFMEGMAFVAQWVTARPSVYGIPASLPFLRLGETNYHAPKPAHQPSSFCVGALSRTLTFADREAAVRRKNAARLTASCDGVELRPPDFHRTAQAGFLRLPVVASPKVAAAARLPDARRLGIMPGYPTTLASLEGFGARQCLASHHFPGANALAERLITLPTHGALSEGDLLRLESWCRSKH